jgi:hypothetical protein
MRETHDGDGEDDHADERAGGLELGLVELIRALRAELFEASKAGANNELAFEVGPIDLDLEVVVTKGGQGSAGVKFWVLTASGGGTHQSARTQKLHLQLKPITASGTNLRVKDQGVGLPVQGTRPDTAAGSSSAEAP